MYLYYLFITGFLVSDVNAFRVVERLQSMFFDICVFEASHLIWFNFLVMVIKYIINIVASFHAHLVFLPFMPTSNTYLCYNKQRVFFKGMFNCLFIFYTQPQTYFRLFSTLKLCSHQSRFRHHLSLRRWYKCIPFGHLWSINMYTE